MTTIKNPKDFTITDIRDEINKPTGTGLMKAYDALLAQLPELHRDTFVIQMKPYRHEPSPDKFSYVEDPARKALFEKWLTQLEMSGRSKQSSAAITISTTTAMDDPIATINSVFQMLQSFKNGDSVGTIVETWLIAIGFAPVSLESLGAELGAALLGGKSLVVWVKRNDQKLEEVQNAAILEASAKKKSLTIADIKSITDAKEQWNELKIFLKLPIPKFILSQQKESWKMLEPMIEGSASDAKTLRTALNMLWQSDIGKALLDIQE